MVRVIPECRLGLSTLKIEKAQHPFTSAEDVPIVRTFICKGCDPSKTTTHPKGRCMAVDENTDERGRPPDWRVSTQCPYYP